MIACCCTGRAHADEIVSDQSGLCAADRNAAAVVPGNDVARADRCASNRIVEAKVTADPGAAVTKNSRAGGIYPDVVPLNLRSARLIKHNAVTPVAGNNVAQTRGRSSNSTIRKAIARDSRTAICDASGADGVRADVIPRQRYS